jgi:hypothetical protein
MKSIIFYGTYTILNKNVIKIKSDCYYAFKNSVLEESERIKGYTTMEELSSCIEGHTKRKSLDKEYFIEEINENENEDPDWYVFEYESKSLKTFFKTNATSTIIKLINVRKETEDETESSETESSETESSETESSDSYDKDDYK